MTERVYTGRTMPTAHELKQQHAKSMRTRGFDDGVVPGREPRHPDDKVYMQSFRRGRERLAGEARRG